MPNKRLPMRKIKEVLRLKYVCGLSDLEISQSCKVGHVTVGNYLKRMAAAGLDWADAADLNETELQVRLSPKSCLPQGARRPAPDCQHIYDELRSYKKFNLMLTQLWLEYKEARQDGYEHTQFCEYYYRWREKARLLHASGTPCQREGLRRLL